MSTQVEDKQLPAILQPQWSLKQEIALIHQIEEYVEEALVEGIDHDYGNLPGTRRKVLFKPGAEKLLAYFGLWADPTVDEKREDWNANPPLFDYTVSATIKRKRDDQVQSKAVRSCNSYESKYKYRYQAATCPGCGFELRKSKNADEYYCWQAKGGCGAKYPLDSEEINKPGKVINADIADCKDTVLAMAEKRAIVAATIRATCCSWLFAPDYAPGQAPIDASEVADVETGEVRPAAFVNVIKPADDQPICSPKQRRDFMEDVERFGYTKKDIAEELVKRWPGRFDCTNAAAFEASLNARFTVSMRDELYRDLKELAEGQEINEQFQNALADPSA